MKIILLKDRWEKIKKDGNEKLFINLINQMSEKADETMKGEDEKC